MRVSLSVASISRRIVPQPWPGSMHTTPLITGITDPVRILRELRPVNQMDFSSAITAILHWMRLSFSQRYPPIPSTSIIQIRRIYFEIASVLNGVKVHLTMQRYYPKPSILWRYLGTSMLCGRSTRLVSALSYHQFKSETSTQRMSATYLPPSSSALTTTVY